MNPLLARPAPHLNRLSAPARAWLCPSSRTSDTVSLKHCRTGIPSCLTRHPIEDPSVAAPFESALAHCKAATRPHIDPATSEVQPAIFIRVRSQKALVCSPLSSRSRTWQPRDGPLRPRQGQCCLLELHPPADHPTRVPPRDFHSSVCSPPSVAHQGTEPGSHRYILARTSARHAAMSRAPAGSGSSRKISFNVSEQYDIQDVVGEGAYGVVWLVSCPAANVPRKC